MRKDRLPLIVACVQFSPSSDLGSTVTKLARGMAAMACLSGMAFENPLSHGTRLDFRFRLVSGLYSVCFAIGAFNHGRDFLAHGWRPYSWGPTILEIFWTSLILLDLLVIALLFSQFKRLGLLLAAAVMIADVIANTYALVILKIAAFGVAVPLQATFLGFILGSVPFIWPRKVGQSDHWQ